MLRRLRLLLPLAVVLVSPGSGCKKEKKPSGDGSSEVALPSGKETAPPKRLQTETLERIGDAPGLLADGAAYASVRADSAQEFLRHIPLPPEILRDLARARREIGFDPLLDDVLERFAIPKEAVISMTLGRPLGLSSSKGVAQNLRGRDDRFLKLVAQVLSEDADKRYGAAVEIARPVPRAEPEPVEKLTDPTGIEGGVPQGTIGGAIDPPDDEPTPPAISEKDRREIDQLQRENDAVAMQFRVHIPTDEPNRIFDEFRTRSDAGDRSKGEALCRGQATEFCIGDRSSLIIGRVDGKAVVLDLVLFTGRSYGEADLEARQASVAEAMKAPEANLNVLDQMAGDASLYIDAEAMVTLFEHERIGSAINTLSWNSDEPREAIDRRLREGESLRRMLAAPRLFEGLLANAHHQRDHTQLQVSWPLREGQQLLAAKSLAPPPLRVPVPAIDALCDGALFCGRTRGLPRPEQLGTSLGLGIYGDMRALDGAFGDADEMAAMLLLVSTWPNGLGSLMWHLPLGEARGPEAALVRGALDALGRIQGFGFSVRSVDVGRRSLQASYAAYARVPSGDLALVNTALALAEMRMTATTVEGIEGPVMMLRAPDDDIPAVLMSRNDPEAVAGEDGKDVSHGWLTVVDDPKRLAWLLDLPTDDGATPFAYGEVADLWRLMATVPDVVDELGFARTWATERAFKVSLGIDEGKLQLVMDLAVAAQSE